MVVSSQLTWRAPSGARYRLYPATRARSRACAASSRPPAKRIRIVSKKSPDPVRCPKSPQGRGQHGGATVRARGDGGQPVRPVVHGVHGGGHGQQDLGGADVAGRLLAADVLLAGLQREPVGGLAVGVHRHADQPAGQLALERVADRDVARVRAAEPQRHAEPLGGADRDVRAAPRPAGGAASARAGRRPPRPARPRACAASISGARSRMTPDAPGYCSRTPNRSSLARRSPRP